MEETFIDQLARATLPVNVFNQYAYGPAYNADRRHNLALYFEQMREKRPWLLLVAEAPGYRGCRLTGVPFASPVFMADGVETAALFGTQRGYRAIDEWPHIRREASATIVWETLNRRRMTPLIWNAFPWHPHRPGQPASNRAPTRQEIALGEPFIRQLRRAFPIRVVAAVGNKAEHALTRWQIPFRKVRHPSHGGKAEFQAGIAAIVAEHAEA